MLWELRTDVVVVVVSWCSGLFVGVVGVMVVVVVDVVVVRASLKTSQGT